MKILLIVLSATVATLPGNAQIQFGIKASANFCSLIGPDATVIPRQWCIAAKGQSRCGSPALFSR